MVPDFQTYLDFAKHLAFQGGQIAKRYFRRDLAVFEKGDGSPVTIADQEAEWVMRELIRRHYPDHGILGEEEGEENPNSPFCWVLDPIDGTKAFLHGVPLFTVLVGLMVETRPVLGIVHQPVLEETVWATAGQGCYYNGLPTRIRDCPGLDHAWLQTTDPADLLRTWPSSERLLSRVRACRTWGDGYGYLLLVSGRADLMVDARMNPWDVLPLVPLVEEAGGYLADLHGRTGAGDSCIAGSRSLVEEALALL